MDTKTVLAVDDDPGMLEMLRVGLELEGYRVITALDGRTALRKIRAENPALVILDVMMPGMDGWEVLDRIESSPQMAGIPVIMLTALVEDMDVMRGLEKGAIDYITKPFDVTHLVNAIGLISARLDARGRDAYRRELMARRKRLMRDLSTLFPGSTEQDN